MTTTPIPADDAARLRSAAQRALESLDDLIANTSPEVARQTSADLDQLYDELDAARKRLDSSWTSPRCRTCAAEQHRTQQRSEARVAELEQALREADAEAIALAEHNDATCEAVAARDRSDDAINRVRCLADLIEAGAPWTANHRDTANRIRNALDQQPAT
ncbi:hypothetical protein ACFYXM_10635 [Streptomyces sp. NPDC002476]|uniref:hypothetical protein n=1 Tax=Streptomyces sp. NPDC002476 TaxID=3364648 RepID=UPI0036B6B056